MSLLKNLMTDQNGATAIEYALIASLICLGIIAGAAAIGGNLSDSFNYIAGQLKTS